MMNYRVQSWNNISNKFPQLCEEKFVGKPVSKILEILDSEHPFHTFNFYVTVSQHTVQGVEGARQILNKVLNDYFTYKTAFDDLSEQSKDCLSQMHEMFESADVLDSVPLKGNEEVVELKNKIEL